MSKNSTIDTVFKTRLGDMERGDADAMWERMEAKLLQQKEKKDHRTYLLWLLLLVPVAAGLMLTANKTDHKKAGIATTATTSKQVIEPGGTPPVEAAASTATNNTAANNNIHNKTVSYCPVQPGWYKNGVFVPSGSIYANPGSNTIKAGDGSIATAVFAGGDETSENAEPPAVGLTAPDKIAAEGIAAIPGGLQQPLSAGKKIVIAANRYEAAATATAVENKACKKPQASVAAGTDVFARSRPGGKYALLLLQIPLNTKSTLSLGAGISSHSTSQNYMVAEKQATLNREVDAKLRGLTMLQFPVLYEQALPGKKFTAKAGVTPVYILNAAVTNVPNSFTGVIIPYRSFGLSDINRFNVLFTAGLQYNITPKIGVEVRGNYGLTELVKNSYLNQSNENNNFKAVQLGLSWNFGRKK
jgi:Outer membrane protein beta-barrel domain